MMTHVHRHKNYFTHTYLLENLLILGLMVLNDICVGYFCQLQPSSMSPLALIFMQRTVLYMNVLWRSSQWV